MNNDHISTSALYGPYLAHYGVLGMKWGVRKNKDKNKKYVDNYSAKQRAYDKKIYGAGSVRRINKRMANGEGIKSARHNEVVRKKNISTAKTVAGIAGSALLVTAGSIAVSKFLQQKGVSLDYAPAFNDAAISIGKAVIHRFL